MFNVDNIYNLFMGLPFVYQLAIYVFAVEIVVMVILPLVDKVLGSDPFPNGLLATALTGLVMPFWVALQTLRIALFFVLLVMFAATFVLRRIVGVFNDPLTSALYVLYNVDFGGEVKASLLNAEKTHKSTVKQLQQQIEQANQRTKNAQQEVQGWNNWYAFAVQTGVINNNDVSAKILKQQEAHRAGARGQQGGGQRRDDANNYRPVTNNNNHSGSGEQRRDGQRGGGDQRPLTHNGDRSRQPQNNRQPQGAGSNRY